MRGPARSPPSNTTLKGLLMCLSFALTLTWALASSASPARFCVPGRCLQVPRYLHAEGNRVGKSIILRHNLSSRNSIFVSCSRIDCCGKQTEKKEYRNYKYQVSLNYSGATPTQKRKSSRRGGFLYLNTGFSSFIPKRQPVSKNSDDYSPFPHFLALRKKKESSGSKINLGTQGRSSIERLHPISGARQRILTLWTPQETSRWKERGVERPLEWNFDRFGGPHLLSSVVLSNLFCEREDSPLERNP